MRPAQTLKLRRQIRSSSGRSCEARGGARGRAARPRALATRSAAVPGAELSSRSPQGRNNTASPRVTRHRPGFSDLPATLLAPRRVSISPLASLARTAPPPSRPDLTGRRGTISTEQQWQKYRPGCGDASAMATAASAPPAPRAAPAAGRLLLPRRPTRPRTLTHGTHGTHGRRGARGGTRATHCGGLSRGERWPH